MHNDGSGMTPQATRMNHEDSKKSKIKEIIRGVLFLIFFVPLWFSFLPPDRANGSAERLLFREHAKTYS